MDRREALKIGVVLPAAVVAGGATGQLATCSSSGGIQINPSVLVAINNAVATGCNFIPAVTTVIALVNALFPAVNGATAVAEGVISQIASMLCSNAPNPASAKLGAKTLKAGDKEIPVNGWVVIDGKLQYV
jgi:hypothetical protein